MEKLLTLLEYLGQDSLDDRGPWKGSAYSRGTSQPTYTGGVGLGYRRLEKQWSDGEPSVRQPPPILTGKTKILRSL